MEPRFKRAPVHCGLRYRGDISGPRSPTRPRRSLAKGMSVMSPATSAQVRRRQAARKQALARQQRLNEERRRRDEQELELAAEFAVLMEECEAARAAVQAAEASMGRVVESMIGELRIRYQRAAQLLATPEDELKRLRLISVDGGRETATDADASVAVDSKPVRAGRPPTSAQAPATARTMTPAGKPAVGGERSGGDGARTMSKQPGSAAGARRAD